MITTLVRLQLSLQRGGFKNNGAGLFGALLMYGLSLTLSAGIIIGAVVLRSHPDLVAPVTVVVTGTLGLSWIVLPALFGNGATALDPSRLALFPIPRRTVAVGLVAAAAVAPVGITVLALMIAAVLVASNIAAAVMGLLAGATLALSCLTCGRLAAAAMSGLFRGRKTRELAGMLAAMLAMGIGLLGQGLSLAVQYVDREAVERIAGVVRWTPFAVAGRAIGAANEGRWLESLISLMIAVAILVGLGALWTLILQRLLSSTAEASAGEADTASLIPNWLAWLPDRPSSVVAGRELRSMRRDPRQWRQIAGFLPIAVVLAVPVAAIGRNEPRAPLHAAVLGISVGFLTLNLFGADGRSASGDLLVIDSVRTIFNGKQLGWALALVPLALVVVIGLSIFTRSFFYLIPSVLLSSAVFLVAAGVGAVTSAVAPMTLPEGMGWGGANMGQGCLTGLMGMVGLFSATVLAFVPVGLVVGGSFVAPWSAYPAALFAVVYGLVVRHVGVSLGVARIEEHRPEFLAKLT